MDRKVKTFLSNTLWTSHSVYVLQYSMMGCGKVKDWLRKKKLFTVFWYFSNQRTLKLLSKWFLQMSVAHIYQKLIYWGLLCYGFLLFWHFWQVQAASPPLLKIVSNHDPGLMLFLLLGNPSAICGSSSNVRNETNATKAGSYFSEKIMISP